MEQDERARFDALLIVNGYSKDDFEVIERDLVPPIPKGAVAILRMESEVVVKSKSTKKEQIYKSGTPGPHWLEYFANDLKQGFFK